MELYEEFFRKLLLDLTDKLFTPAQLTALLDPSHRSVTTFYPISSPATVSLPDLFSIGVLYPAMHVPSLGISKFKSVLAVVLAVSGFESESVDLFDLRKPENISILQTLFVLCRVQD
jgi:hypothetical protein